MAPVNMPGTAAGRTTRAMVWLRVAPRARDASRQASGTCLNASSVVLMMTGRVSTASVSTPAEQAHAHAEKGHEERQPEQPEHHGRHAREVADAEPQVTGVPSFSAIFVQIHG